MNLKDPNETTEKIEDINCFSLQKLKYRYPLTNKYVIDDIDITIKHGEKVALVGENGSGKSTFIKITSGLLMPSSGTISINGKVVNIDMINRFESISSVTQNPARYKTFTVGDNIFLGNAKRDRDEKNNGFFDFCWS